MRQRQLRGRIRVGLPRLDIKIGEVTGAEDLPLIVHLVADRAAEMRALGRKEQRQAVLALESHGGQHRVVDEVLSLVRAEISQLAYQDVRAFLALELKLLLLGRQLQAVEPELHQFGFLFLAQARAEEEASQLVRNTDAQKKETAADADRCLEKVPPGLLFGECLDRSLLPPGIGPDHLLRRTEEVLERHGEHVDEPGERCKENQQPRPDNVALDNYG